MDGAGHRLAFVYGAREVLWKGVGLVPSLGDGGVIAATLERCARLIQERLGWSLERTLAAGVDGIPEDRMEPALACVQIALTEGWRDRGIVPQAICGRSAGETAAEYARGTLTLESALEVAIRWGRVAKQRGGGASVLVARAGLARIDALRVASPVEFFIVTDAAETVTLITCARASVQRVTAYLGAQGVGLAPTRFNYGPHSPLIDGWKSDFLEPPVAAQPPDPAIAYYSSGAQAPDVGSAHPMRMWQSARAPALLGPTLRRMVQDGYDVFVEVGGRAGLAELLGERAAGFAALPTMRVGQPARAVMEESAQALRRLGIPARAAQ